MRKTLIALAALAGVISASYLAIGTPAPLVTGASGCQEANQLLNCINSQVVALLRGSPGGVALTAPLSVGSFGTNADNAANVITLNTQGGVLTYTGLTVAANASGNLAQNNTLVTASSACLAAVGADSASNAGSIGFGVRVVPGAGTLNYLLRNTGVNSSGATNVSIIYWCFN